MPSLYLHIPFCEKKCLYCDFYSLPRSCWDEHMLDCYTDALLRELSLVSASLDDREKEVPAIYFGGGTPSLLGPRRASMLLEQIDRLFVCERGCEISMEINPGTIDDLMVRDFRHAGINRASIGAQSLDDAFLRILGRIHRSRDIVSAVESVRMAGFASLGLDLIYGIPGQNLADWRADLHRILLLSPDHVSAYGLTPEEGTPMGDALLSGAQEEVHEDMQILMQRAAEEVLSEGGFRHYEISNYARDGRECLHNTGYWTYQDYLGFGAASWSFRNRWRYGNVRDCTEYIGRISQGFSAVAEAERLSLSRQRGEYMMMALRMADGASVRRFRSLFGEELEAVYHDMLARCVAEGLIQRRDCPDGDRRFSIPEHRLMLHNEIAAFFIEDAVEDDEW